MVYFGLSDVGKKRQYNQDTFLCAEPAPNIILCTVCDGMGGANGGSVASSIACKAFTDDMSAFIAQNIKDGTFSSDSMEIQRALISASETANKRVYEESRKDPALVGMGTTLVAALFHDGFVHALNIGDSRLYFIKDGVLRQITHDHSYVQYLVDNGMITVEEAENNPKKNIITRAVGTKNTVEADTFFINSSDGGYFLLCSDGLTNFVKDDMIHAIIVSNAYQTVPEKVKALVEAANDSGGGDNITAVLISL